MPGRGRFGYVPRAGSDAGFGVEIVGMPEVTAMLAKYQQPQLDEKLRVGMKAAGRALAKSVRAAAPPNVRRGVPHGFGRGSSHQPGDLYRSIRSRSQRGSPPAVAVGPMSRMRHLAIRPTRAHVISPLRSHFLAIASGGRFATVVHHPGNKAHPWVESGVRNGRAQARDAAANAIFRNVLLDPAGGDD